MDQSPNQFSTHLRKCPSLRPATAGSAPEGNPRADPEPSADRVPVEKSRGRGRAVLESLGGRVHGEDHVEVADDLAGEPLVQLLVRVQHQALLLGPLFALGHQGGVLIAFEQTRNLGDKQQHARLVLVTRPRNRHQCHRPLHHLPIGQQRVHSLQESRI